VTVTAPRSHTRSVRETRSMRSRRCERYMRPLAARDPLPVLSMTRWSPRVHLGRPTIVSGTARPPCCGYLPQPSSSRSIAVPINHQRRRRIGAWHVTWFRWGVLRWCILAEESSDKTITSARLNPQFGMKTVARPYARWVAECYRKLFIHLSRTRRNRARSPQYQTALLPHARLRLLRVSGALLFCP